MAEMSRFCNFLSTKSHRFIQCILHTVSTYLSMHECVNFFLFHSRKSLSAFTQAHYMQYLRVDIQQFLRILILVLLFQNLIYSGIFVSFLYVV